MLRDSKRLVRRSFNIYKQKLDPTKHIFLTNNPVMGISENWAWMGRLFIPKGLPYKTASGAMRADTFEHTKIFFEELYPEINWSEYTYGEMKNNSLGCTGVEPTEGEIGELIKFLNLNVVARGHPLRHGVESRARCIGKNSSADLRNVLLYKEFDSFVEMYCSILEEEISKANLYRTREVIGSAGWRDDLPDFMNEEEVREKQERYRNDLLHKRDENSSMINSAMVFLHS